MSGARYHLLSLVAVLVAIVTGVLLGAGPIEGQARDRQAAQTQRLREQQRVLRDRVFALEERSRRERAFAGALVDPLTGGQLADRSVAVFALPGSGGRPVARAVAALEGAGAKVTTTVRLTRVYVDPAKARSPLEDLALRLVPPGVEFPDESTPIQRVGTVLARATVTDDPDETGRVEQRAAELLAGLEELGAVRVSGDPGLRAELAVVVAARPAAAGRGAGAAAGPGQPDAALLGLTAALTAGSSGTVVLGAGPARAGDLVAAVRAAQGPAGEASTVEGTGPTGRIALVLALAEQAAGGDGDYGAGATATAVLPDLRPLSDTPARPDLAAASGPSGD